MPARDRWTPRALTAALLLHGLLCFGPLVLPAPAEEAGDEDAAEIRELLGRVQDRDQRRLLLNSLREGRIDLEQLRERVAPAAVPLGDIEPPARGGPLGATLAPNGTSTTFRLFSPRALKATVITYEDPDGGQGTASPMKKDASGVWSATVDGAGAGTYYQFAVDGPSGPGEVFDPLRPISDPYARANVGSSGRSIVVDPSFDWGRRVAGFSPPAQKDAVVYEMHVKDFTQHASSGVQDEAARGKYLGLTQGAGTDKVLGHLKELGVNVVELLPVHEFDNNAAPPGHINHWGYMTSHFFAPESSYASSATDGSAVRELKTAIKALKEAGIAVVLDVVYNHTSEGNEDGPVFNFKGIDNKLFYRLTPDFFYWNGTGCGNELASERPAVRQFIVDSVKFWQDEYRVDGFRFDLGASLDRETLLAVKRSLRPGAILFAEPWTADWSRRQWDKGHMRGSGWGLWNDGYRENVKALLDGNASIDDLMTTVSGSCMWFAAKPEESLNYVEAHDGYTLEDHLHGNVKKNHLAAVALMTSMGVPMLHEGQEIRKTKRGNHNSYDQDNEVNWIDWGAKEKHEATFDFYSGLIALRNAYAAFRRADCLSDQSVKWLRPSNPQGLGYLLRGPGRDPDVLVLLNGHGSQWADFTLPMAGDWTILCNGEKVDLTGALGTAAGDYKVPPTTGVVLRAPAGQSGW